MGPLPPGVLALCQTLFKCLPFQYMYPVQGHWLSVTGRTPAGAVGPRACALPLPGLWVGTSPCPGQVLSEQAAPLGEQLK